MQPNRFGRVLGLSARFAAEKLRDRAAQVAPPVQRTAAVSVCPPASRAASHTSSHGPAPANRSRVSSSSTNYAEGSRRLARGAGRFGASLWRPFAHATGVLTLQISGVFFAMFSIFFIEHAWQTYRVTGPHGGRLLVYSIFALLFAWFTISSFWKARRRQK